MKITWHGHACFTLETNEGRIVFDPYADGSIPGLKPLEISADVILCSHEHFDHNARDVVKQTRKLTHFDIQTLESYHDDKQGTLRGNNMIHIVNTEEMKAVHLGDLGHKLDDYSQLINCDVLMIPVGGHYTIDAKTAKTIVDAINPQVVIPMHYSSDTFGFDEIARVDEFLNITDHHIFYDTNEIIINKDTKQQIAVLKYK